MSSMSSSNNNIGNSSIVGSSDSAPPTPVTRKMNQSQIPVKPPVPAPRTVMLARCTAQSVVTTHTEVAPSGEASTTTSAAFRAVSEAAVPSTGTKLTKIEHGNAHYHITSPPKQSVSSGSSLETPTNASRLSLPVMRGAITAIQPNQGYSYRNSSVFRERLDLPQALHSSEPERQERNDEQRSRNRRNKETQKRTTTQSNNGSKELNSSVNDEEVFARASLISSEGQQITPEEFVSNVRRANDAIQRAWDHMASSSYQQACREFQNSLTSIDSIMRVQIGITKIPPSIRERLMTHQNNLMYKRKEVLEGFSDAQAACRGNAVSSSPPPGAPPSYEDVLRESQVEVNRYSYTPQSPSHHSSREGQTASIAANRNSQTQQPRSPPHHTPSQSQTTLASTNRRHSRTRPTQTPPKPPRHHQRDIQNNIAANRHSQLPPSPSHHIPGDNQVYSVATSDPVSLHRHPLSTTIQDQYEDAHREDQPAVTPRRHMQPLTPQTTQSSVTQPTSIAQQISIVNTHNNCHSSVLRSLNFTPARNSVDSNSHIGEENFPSKSEQVRSPVESSSIYPSIPTIDDKDQCLDNFKDNTNKKNSNSYKPNDSLCKVSDDSLGINLSIPFADDTDNFLNDEISNKDKKLIPESRLNIKDNNEKVTILDPFISTDPFTHEFAKSSEEDIFSDINIKLDTKEEDIPDKKFSDINEKENMDEEYSNIDQNEISNNFTDIDIKQTSTPARYTQLNKGEVAEENPEKKLHQSSEDTYAVSNTDESDYTFSDLVMSRLRKREENYIISEPNSSGSRENKIDSPKRSESVGNLLISFNTPHTPVRARPSVLAMFDPLRTPKSLDKNNGTKKSFRHSMDCSMTLLDKHSTSMVNLPVLNFNNGNIVEENRSTLNYIGEEDVNYSTHSNSQEDIPEAYVPDCDPPPYSVTPNDHCEDDKYGSHNKDIVSISYDKDIPKLDVGRSSFYPDLDKLKSCKLNCGVCAECYSSVPTITNSVMKKESKLGIEYLRIREGIKIFFIFENGKVTSPWKKPVLSILQENSYEGGGNGLILRVGERLWSCQLNKKGTIVLRAESRSYMFAAKQSSTMHHSVSKQQKCSAVAITLPTNLRKSYEERLLYLLRNNSRLEEEEIKGITNTVSKGAASAAAKVNQIMPDSSQPNNNFVRRNSVRALRKAGKAMTKKLNTIADRASIPDMELPEEYAILQEAAKHLQICRSKKEVEYL